MVGPYPPLYKSNSFFTYATLLHMLGGGKKVTCLTVKASVALLRRRGYVPMIEYYIKFKTPIW